MSEQLQTITYPVGSTEAWSQGYNDGWARVSPNLPDNPHYMEGWDEGYRDRVEQYRY